MEINLQLTNDHTFLTVFCIRKQTTFVHFRTQGQHSATIAFCMKSTTEVQTDSLNSLGTWRSRCQPFPASRSLCFFSAVFQEGRSLWSQCWSSFVERTSVCSSWWGVCIRARAPCAPSFYLNCRQQQYNIPHLIAFCLESVSLGLTQCQEKTALLVTSEVTPLRQMNIHLEGGEWSEMTNATSSHTFDWHLRCGSKSISVTTTCQIPGEHLICERFTLSIIWFHFYQSQVLK